MNQWYVAFGIKASTITTVHWTNIFQFILPGNYRILSGWILPKSRAFLLCQKIATKPPAHTEICHNLGNVPASKFTHVQIRQTLITALNKYEFIVIFDSKVTKIKLTNPKPRGYENIMIWISDPWNHPAKVTLKNFVFQNLPHGKYKEIVTTNTTSLNTSYSIFPISTCQSYFGLFNTTFIPVSYTHLTLPTILLV